MVHWFSQVKWPGSGLLGGAVGVLRDKRATAPIIVAEPEAMANSFVGTEEYLSPEVVSSAGHNGSVDWWSLGIFIHELLLGCTPFKGARRDNTFHNILHKKLSFPDKPEISAAAKDLITKLLVKDPANRLGTLHGAEEVKAHPWFADINFELMRQTPPPFPYTKPRPLDTNKFEQDF